MNKLIIIFANIIHLFRNKIMKPLSLFLLLCLVISCGSNKTSDAYSCRLEASGAIQRAPYIYSLFAPL